MKRQRMKIGAFVKILLEDGTHVYARIGNQSSFHIYNLKVTEDITNMAKIASLPILFVARTDKQVITKGRWQIVGWLPLEPALEKNPLLYMPDITDPDNYRIYDNGDVRPATKEETINLEVLTAWHPTEIEERILDHYRGRKNEKIRRLEQNKYLTILPPSGDHK